MAGLKVLITSFMCVQRTGLEVYVRDVALGLQQRGHVPIIYSPLLGELAQTLRSKTIPVVDDLNAVGTFPDIIHGHHHLETMTALLHFPGVPAIYFCHNSFSPLDSPPPSPRVLRCVAVDQPCYEKLVFEHGVPPERARLLLNFVDGARFKPRTALPSRPQHALLYGNYATEDANLAAVREACSRAGLQLDVVGLGVGNNVTEPETLLGKYDIVFAKSRAAAEALTVGTAVVIYCMRSVGPMVTASELERLLPLNFGIRTMKSHRSPESLTEALSQEIARYDAQDAAEASSRVRNLLQSDRAIDEILSLYEEVIREHRNAGTSDALTEGRAAAGYIRWLSGRVSQHLGMVIASPVVQPQEPLENEPVVGGLEARLESESLPVGGEEPEDESQAAALSEALAAESTEMARVKAELEAARSEGVALAGALEVRSAEATEIAAALMAEERRTAELAASLAVRSAALAASLEARALEAAALRAEAHAWRDRTTRSEDEIAARIAELHDIRQSTSWRVTQPIRWVGRRIARARHGHAAVHGLDG